MLVTFPGFKGSAVATFKCLVCEKDKRKRTFTVENTVNPYNRNPDGVPKGWEQVRREAREAATLERDQFMAYPLCKSCEDNRGWSEMKSINARRRSSAVSPQELRPSPSSPDALAPAQRPRG